jgi:hypothetical protein
MPAVLPLMPAASRSSTRRRISTPRKRREAPSIPAAGQNVACKSPEVRICVEELLIFGRVHSVASGSSAARKRSLAGTWHYSRLFVEATPWQERILSYSGFELLWFVRLNPWPSWRTRLWLAGRWECRDRHSSTNPRKSRRTAAQRLHCPSSSARGRVEAGPGVR